MSKTIYETHKIFVPGGMPQHTYVVRAEIELEDQLIKASRGHKLVALTGATKSGKTVLTRRLFPRGTGTAVWVDGGMISTENDLWNCILDECNSFTDIEEISQTERGNNLSGTVGGSFGMPGLGGKGETTTGTMKKTINALKQSRSISPKIAAIRALQTGMLPLIIDDFHYIKKELQGRVVRSLKPLAFEGVPIIIIAIPHRRFDVVKVEKEMTGRLETVEVPSWTEPELLQIPTIGFPFLNMELAIGISKLFCEEAYGSPHLMQDFCKIITGSLEVKKTLDEKMSVKVAETEKFFKYSAESLGKVIFDKLARGPRQRSDRKKRQLIVGGTADIYKVVLLGLARINPGMQSVSYEELRFSIREIVIQNDMPQANEISRVLEKMSEIAADDESSSPVLDWEKEDQRLHITDPFFAFYLKWGIS